MPTLFVSDLHLDASRPGVTDNFLAFLETIAGEATTLYILGDLFEAWLGDDDPEPHGCSVIDALRRFTNAGNHCCFTRGNRDFLIGEHFCRETGAELLPEATVIDLHGERVLLMHGDELCTDDMEYQRFRRIVRHPTFKRLSDGAPMWLRRFIGGRMRSTSQARTPYKPDSITDVNQASVEAAMRAHNVRTLVHGHTHRPAIHSFRLDENDATRIVLGDWYTQGSVLDWRESGYELIKRPYA